MGEIISVITGSAERAWGDRPVQSAIFGSGVVDHAHGFTMARLACRIGQLAHDIHAGQTLGRVWSGEGGNGHTTYTQFNRWGESGVGRRVCEIVSGDRDLKMLMIDSTVVRAHQHAAGAKKKRGHRQ